LALWRKYRLEERWMAEQFGDAYARYRAAVPALIPFLR
jgi:protein-S-isoprenylcysteine O-methyltransferase Ste14